MYSYLVKNKVLFFAEVIMAIGHALFDAALAVSMGQMTNAAVDGELKVLLYSSMQSVGCLIVIYFFSVFEMRFRKKLTGKCLCAIKEDIYKAISKKGVASMHEKADSFYINLLQGDMELLERDCFDSLLRGINLTIQTVFCVIALNFISVKLVIIFTLLCVFPQLASRFFRKALTKRKDAFSLQNSRCVQAEKEYIGGFDTIAYYSKWEAFISRLMIEDKALEDCRRKRDVCQVKVSYGVTTINMIAQMLCMAAAAYFVAIGELKFGALTASTQLLNFIFSPLNTVINCVLSMLSTRGVRDKVAQIVDFSSGNGKERFSLGDISFSNVTVGYGDKAVLCDFSYIFTKGGKYAIIGSSGVGKSTIVKALMRTARVNKGSITIGNTNIKDIALSELYKNILYVPQKPYLFEGTVLENISFYGDEGAARNAARAAALPDELLIQQAGGDYGNKISGGEMSRISVARAFCSNASVIIFDEPTSGLDPETAEEIEKRILDIKDKTIIVITHNWNQTYLDMFDKVINVTNGEPA
ncbi:MAG: ABC transporter ATP-binding protein/permease [Lachnospiraceae bacterium]|nr:ABC transporter ATP-binding protein/permease [Lachnospiraceae bacterium]